MSTQIQVLVPFTSLIYNYLGTLSEVLIVETYFVVIKYLFPWSFCCSCVLLLTSSVFNCLISKISRSAISFHIVIAPTGENIDGFLDFLPSAWLRLFHFKIFLRMLQKFNLFVSLGRIFNDVLSVSDTNFIKWLTGVTAWCNG